ncbi:DUF397 domain-containing protein [Streptomyces chromofuscus]|uniref:DUF397 domain-containing protein n=1 Tax=Streptomyces chromofuscus TaxID=42881 RepID=A0A7M2TEU3_STRCW|nr:DUF397 domain-containing protein [Streptomyces chromofuscus]QOV47236.1 DUF397 domain-containing protein [Streptomyces chromofuscus]GGT24384.1 hypothetical protein GCM10010254_50980 [Streptomyces chromofuscus]
MTTSTLTWFKSSYSGNDEPDCVEVAMSHPAVHVRDSKDRHRAPLAFGQRAWRDFVELVVD